MNAPGVEKRRKKEFAAELLARARAWIPDWEMDPAARDFGMALLDIAARFDSEVAERLDRSGEKNRRGLLDWLGIRGEAARAARVPVVLRLGERNQNTVMAKAPVKLRADTAAGPVVFETETTLTLVPGKLAALVAVDPAADAFYLPPPGIDNVERRPVLPDSWRTKAFADGGAARLQLDPELGLASDMLVQVNGLEYRLMAVDKDLVTLDPVLAAGIEANTVVTRVTAFTPFESAARNRQRHALYVGDDQLLDIKAAATIAVDGLSGVPEGARWEYWGRQGDGGVGWQLLRPANDSGAPLALAKPAGALEPYAVNGIESRWIRAVIDNYAGNAIAFDRLQLRINPVAKPNDFPSCGLGVSPEIEGVANNTPQVLNGVFYPFGREPRLNDTFYLGCAEAFSKKKAAVTVCFDLADPTMKAVTVVPPSAWPTAVLAATGQDGYLHLLQLASDGQVTPLRPPVQPPSPSDSGTNPGEPTVQLDRQENEKDGPPARAAAWAVGNDFYVAVAADSAVWVWHENPPSDKQAPSPASGWINFGAVATLSDRPKHITDLVVSGDSLYALRDGHLFRRPRLISGSWHQVEWTSTPVSPLTALAAVTVAGTTSAAAVAPAPPLCALSEDGHAYIVRFSERDAKDQKGGKETVGNLDQLPGMANLNGSVRPVALMRLGADNKVQLAVAAVVSRDNEPCELLTFLAAPYDAERPCGELNTLALPGRVSGRDLEGAEFEGEFTVFAATEHVLIGATPFSKPWAKTVMEFPISAEHGIAGGGPAWVGPTQIVVPGTRSDLLVGAIKQAAVKADLASDAFVDALAIDSRVALLKGDLFVFLAADATALEIAVVADKPVTYGDKLLYPLNPHLKPSAPRTGQSWLFMKQSHMLTRVKHFPLKLVIGDLDVDGVEYLLVSHGKVKRTANRIEAIDIKGTEPRTVTMTQPLPSGTGQVECWRQIASSVEIGMEIKSMLTLSSDASLAWNDALVRRYPIHFDGLKPSSQRAVEIDPNVNPRRLLLPERFESPPTKTVEAKIDGLKIEWDRRLGETADNPLLSWEYWNGSGWWKLELNSDATANFQRRGDLRLEVPDDLQSSEWAGKNNFWIRARLVGGDYGRERVTSVNSKVPGQPEQQQQEVRRDASNIHAPAVLHLELRYALPATTPANILTLDNGTARNQSGANRTAGAIVEAFVPLREMLARLGASAPPATRSANSGCCATDSNEPDTAVGGAADGRAIYLGFDGRLHGEGINILLLPSAEHNFDDFAPARVDVLRGTRFEPVVAADATRALGEAGILSIGLASPPEPAELFGRTLAWLRIRPRDGATDKDWKPALGGAYLNAVWAEAAETQEFEMLGSSQGAPFQQVLLARPPVLQGTLELRVREQLGEEERESLQGREPGSVRSAVARQPGDWVLWKQVVDPADEDARSRVYSLDEATGTIRFGDGIHGAIPPIGRDAIMAFRYRRTEAAAASANAVQAGSSLSIVTPVAGAEAAFTADQVAGGSPAEDLDRVLRFAPAHLRQRGAAVTARDLEDMALMRLPEAAQARCLLRGAAVRLVVVMNGAEPRPTRAHRRELRRAVLEASPPALSASGAFDVVEPAVLPFYVRIQLAAATLDRSAALVDAARNALAALFDPASGAPDGHGWRLGARPAETDIAAAVIDLPYLDAIVDVRLYERDGAGLLKPLRDVLRDDELAVLAADGIELLFELLQEAP